MMLKEDSVCEMLENFIKEMITKLPKLFYQNLLDPLMPWKCLMRNGMKQTMIGWKPNLVDFFNDQTVQLQ
jgi:hypothetical protein